MPDPLDNLPSELNRHRVMSTAASAAFCGLSVPTWRRRYREDPEFPKPVRLSARKLGWRVCDLLDWMESKREAA